jgi:hypothetical protein
MQGMKGHKLYKRLDNQNLRAQQIHTVLELSISVIINCIY